MPGWPPVEGDPDPVALVGGRLQENGPYSVDDVLVLGGEVGLIGGW